MSNYERQFVSCEDEMLPHSNSYGMYNVAASLTSIVIMWLPLFVVYRAFFAGKWIIEIRLYSLSQTLLFFGNLYQHWTGYLGPPCMDTLGCVNNVMFSTILYRVWWYKTTNSFKQQQASSSISLRPSPNVFTCFMVGLATLLLLTGFYYGIEGGSFLTRLATAPVSVYVVYMTGRLSYQQQRQQQLQWKEKEQTTTYNNNTWKLFQTAVALLLLVIGSVEAERFLCPYLPSDFGKRAYHAIYLHIIITALFWSLSELAFSHVSILMCSGGLWKQ